MSVTSFVLHFDSRELASNWAYMRFSRCVVPLMRESDRSSDLEIFASGLLYNNGDRSFILTAKHNFDGFTEQPLYIHANTSRLPGKNLLRAESGNVQWGS